MSEDEFIATYQVLHSVNWMRFCRDTASSNEAPFIARAAAQTIVDVYLLPRELKRTKLIALKIARLFRLVNAFGHSPAKLICETVFNGKERK